MCAAGYTVHLLDLQGHGRSEAYEGLSCHVEKFQDFVDDVVQFVGVVKSGSSCKTYLLGESLGGCVVARVAQELGDGIDGEARRRRRRLLCGKEGSLAGLCSKALCGQMGC